MQIPVHAFVTTGMHARYRAVMFLPSCFSLLLGLQVSRIPEDTLSAITAQTLQGLSYLHRYKHTVSTCHSRCCSTPRCAL